MKWQGWFNLLVACVLIVLIGVSCRLWSEINVLQSTSATPVMYMESRSPAYAYLGVYKEAKKEIFLEAAKAVGVTIWFGPALDRKGRPLGIRMWNWVSLYSTGGDMSDFWDKVEELEQKRYLTPTPPIQKEQKEKDPQT